MSEIIALLQKELRIELRRKHTLAGIFLFAIILVYILYKSFNKMIGMEWNVMLWIFLLFAGINAIAKSFSQEANDTKIYYFTTVKPEHFIISKLIYNVVYLGIVFMVVLAGFTFFLDYPIIDNGMFIQAAGLGIIGLATIMTLVAAVSGESEGGSALLMSIMAIPLTIPVILLLIKITGTAIGRIQDSSVGKDLAMLGGLDLLLIGLTFVLFNQVWKN